MHRPRVLLLDEPSAGLDPEQRIAFRSNIRALSPDTLTVLSTHSVVEVTHLASSVCVLDQGRIVYSGTVEQLADLGGECEVGDSPLERGFAAVRRSPAEWAS